MITSPPMRAVATAMLLILSLFAIPRAVSAQYLGHAVDPDGESANAVAGTTTTVPFTLHNIKEVTDQSSDTFEMSCDYTDPVSSCDHPWLVSVERGSSANVDVAFNAYAAGSAYLYLRANDYLDSGITESGSYIITATDAGPPPQATVSVTPDGAQITVPSAQDRTYPFTITNTGQVDGDFNLSVTCSTWLTSCSSPFSLVTLAGGADTIVNVSYRSPLGSNSGRFTLRATNSADITKLDSGSVQITSTESSGGGAVSPDTRVLITPGRTVDGKTPVTVTITWCNYAPGMFDLSTRVITANNVNVTGNFSDPAPAPPSACDYEGDVSDQEFNTSTGVVTVDMTTGPVAVKAQVSNVYGYLWQARSTFNPPEARRGVLVVADNQFVDAPPSTPRADRFVVTNTGTAPDTIEVTLAGCVGGAIITSACTLDPTGRFHLESGQALSVTANYTTSTAVGSSGLVTVRASSRVAPDVTDSSWTDVTVAAPPAVGVTIVGMAPGLNDVVSRGACVTIALTDDAASECGDLRLVHALPAIRTMGTVRAPTLLYNSQHARPKPLVAADIRLSDVVALPPSVTACIKVAGASRGCQTWPGSSWGAQGNTRRVVIAGDDGAWNTGVVDYTLEVSTSNQGPYHRDARLLIVNRTNSPFGAGWWMAGLEQVVELSANDLLWIGGDGSARRYVRRDSVWLAPKFAALDSIKGLQPAGTGYVRRTAEHAEVYFGAGGQHDSTVNSLGHVTRFGYTGGLLTTIGVPKPAQGAEYYALAYVSGLLDSVAAPGMRGTKLFRAGARVDSIRDPDSHVVRFTSDAGLNQYVVKARKDRRGQETFFDYDGGNRLSGARRPLSNTTALLAGETQGLATPLAVEAAFTQIDGPRTDVSDGTRLWLNGHGAPWRSRNALGQETRVIYNTIWGGLADSTVGPNRLATRASYDATRGLIQSVTVYNPLGTGVNAVTQYQWHPSLNRVTSVRTPTGANAWLLDTISYNANGTKEWEQRGTEATRVNYLYSTDKLPESVILPGSTYRLKYGSLGNVQREESALGFLTFHFEDHLGRDTLVITPRGDPARAADSVYLAEHGVRHRTEFDVMSRPWRSMTVGPATTVPAPSNRVVPADTITVLSEYNEEGQPRTVTRSYTSRMDATVNRTLQASPSEWEYDSLNRVVRQKDAGSAWTELTLDGAGNATETLTPRGHVIKATYDALNRVKSRVVPGVTFSESGCHYILPGQPACTYQFPTMEGPTLCIADDSSRFGYDVTGTLKFAENNWAKVGRRWSPNGLLTREKLSIRRYETVAPGPCGGADKHAIAESSSDWWAHRYELKYDYDLAGRRIALHHPDQLDACAGSCVQRYGYDATTGTLDTLIHPSATGASLTTRFTHDAQGRLRTTYHPGGVSTTRSYDADGRLEFRDGPSINDVLQYDATGRVIAGTVQRPTGESHSLSLAYSGLGALQWAAGPTAGVYYEEYKTDALGNRLWVRDDEMVDRIDRTKYNTFDDASGQLRSTALGTAPCDALVPMRPSCHPAWYRFEFEQNHDAAGNVDATWGIDTRGTSAFDVQEVPDESRSIYAADDKLTYFNRHLGWSLPGEGTGVFEEYRYDALGRRVYVRSRRPSTCAYPCEAYVQRTVWDGDQVLYEIRSSGKSGVDPTFMDGEGRADPGDDPNLYGIVAYAHAQGIDQPVGMLKKYADDGAWGYVTPHANWKGEWSHGTYADGTFCLSTGRGCPTWPGFFRSMDGSPDGVQPQTYTVWWGNIVRGQADASGLQYMRNRYYDPKTGRFTQQDPIGLAGGLNLYGFAGGDPVNFSDPFGLCPGLPGKIVCWWLRRGAVATAAAGAALTGMVGTRTAYGPLNPGPLGDDLVQTFRSGTYNGVALAQSTRLYRVVSASDEAAQLAEPGRFWTTEKPGGPLQAIIDFALHPSFKNKAETILTADVPPGTVVYEGIAAAQGGGLIGGGVQVIIPKPNPAWIVK